MRDKVVELFYQLADFSLEERTRYLAAREIDAETRKEVEALLAFDSFDSAPLLRNIGIAADSAVSRLDPTGRRCGPYRLVRPIGHGGMGVVYFAERVDGEVTQRAAVKLLQPGFQDAQRERFLHEREILAALSHPNIAHLLDAGHLDDGQPFLAMEYIEGKAIDVAVAGLGLRQILQLFLKVCAAVAYLHRNLVVHRDLKPSNIVVTESGEPKLLDFGIAKILDLATDSTMTGVRMLTPDFASPEQLVGGRASTPSDVYSLAAVLYYLLTNRPPREFTSESGPALAAAIATQEVTRPSKYLPALKGDLDFILRKALRNEPQERYSTVEQFAEDIEAFLESRPIRARKGELAYRAGKLARRHWLPLTFAALAVFGLLVSLFVLNRERAMAQRRFNEVRQLSNKLFDIDRQVLGLPGSSKVRQLIVDTSLNYLRQLAADARSDPDLALEVGAAYLRVGRVQGVPIAPNLGQVENAEQNLRIADNLVRSVLVSQPKNRTAFIRLAQIAHDRMVLAQARRPDTEALPLARQSEEWLEKYLASGPIEKPEEMQVTIVGMNVANWYVHKDQTEAGLRLLRRTIEIAKATRQTDKVGGAQIVMARALRSAGDLDGALAAIREGVFTLDPPPGEKTPGLLLAYALALSTQGEILGQDGTPNLGRPREAAEYFERSLNIAADLVRQDPNDAFSRMSFSGKGTRLASVVSQWDPHRAIALYDEVLARLAEVKNNSRARREEVRALAGSAAPLRRTGNAAEARKRLDAAFALLRDLKLYPADQVELGSEPDDTLRASAEQEAAGGNVPQGIEIYQQLRFRIMASQPKPDSDLSDAASLSGIEAALAALHRKAGQLDSARQVEARRLDLWRRWDRKLPNNPFVQHELAAQRPPQVSGK